MAVNLIGFDSAWVDNPKKPGAICALRGDGGHSTFVAPMLAGFEATPATDAPGIEIGVEVRPPVDYM